MCDLAFLCPILKPGLFSLTAEGLNHYIIEPLKDETETETTINIICPDETRFLNSCGYSTSVAFTSLFSLNI